MITVVSKPLKSLKPYPKNPRKNENAVASVVNSIREFGFKVPIIIDKNDVVVAGHTRIKAAERLNITEVPCIVADDLTEDQIRAFRIADNSTAQVAEWNYELLKVEMENLPEFSFQDFGFDMSEMEFVFDLSEEVTDDGFDPGIADKIKEPVSKRGSIWRLGDHRLMCGDATVKADLAQLMNGQLADMIWTDPPYNVDYVGGDRQTLNPEERKKSGSLTIQNDHMDDEKFQEFLFSAFAAMIEYSKQGAAIYVAHADTYGKLFRDAFQDAGWLMKQCLIWVKNNIIMGRQDYNWQHEPILYGWKPGAGHKWYADRSQSTVLRFDHMSKNKAHPTIKPIPLVAYCIKNSSMRGDIVLDTFAGSGSTLIASEQKGRIAYVRELDPVYADVIVKRWEAFTGNTAVLEERGNS